MKVAMLTSVGDRCGIAAYTRALVAGLEQLPDIEVETVPIAEGRQPIEHYREQAERLNAADVVHIQHEHGFWGGIMPRSSAFWEMRYLITQPVVLTAHTTYSLGELLRIKSERRPHKWLAKQILLHNTGYRESVDIAPFVTAMTIVHTEAAKKELVARGAQDGYLTVIPAGVPAPISAESNGDAFRTRHGLQGKRVLTIFGFIAPNKGYELTLDILPGLPEDTVFVIAGGSRTPDMEPYANQLRARIADSGLANRVVITGFVPDAELGDAMAASDLVLVPHTQATGSYSVTIPLSHGRPILASDMDCFTEIQGRVDCLELFPSGDAEKYRTRLLALLDNADRRATLAANALKYAKRFSWKNVAEYTTRIYRAAIDIYGKGHHPHDKQLGKR